MSGGDDFDDLNAAELRKLTGGSVAPAAHAGLDRRARVPPAADRAPSAPLAPPMPAQVGRDWPVAPPAADPGDWPQAPALPVAALSQRVAMPSWFSAALAAAAPEVNLGVWIPLLLPPMARWDMLMPRRACAFFGQARAEAGPGFTELAENMNYTSASHIFETFPNEVCSLGVAQRLVCNPELLANTVYCNRNGNGSFASGDGYALRGSSLLQLTGGDEIGPFATWAGLSKHDAATFLRTREGAAVGACWLWDRRKLNVLADAWHLTEITRRINGSAMMALQERIAASGAALAACASIDPGCVAL